MLLDEVLRLESFDNLQKQGVPEFFQEKLRQEYKDWTGRKIYHHFRDAYVKTFDSMATWYSAIPYKWSIAVGYTSDGIEIENVYKMDDKYPACVLKGINIYVYSPK